MSNSITRNVRVRKAMDRGYANHGWLSTYHTFSFADYHDPEFSGWSSLRVLNEDRVKPGKGFGAHPHSNYEIFTYVISGHLEHRDSMGNQEVISRGGVQFTSAGKGIVHSEYNHSKTESVHFLQLWVRPNRSGLEPNYQTVAFSEEEKQGKLCLIVASKQYAEESSKKPIIINQDVKVYASLLAKDEEVTYSAAPGRCAYLHVCESGGSLRIQLQRDDDEQKSEEIVLEPGDGAFVKEGTPLRLSGSHTEGSDKRVEFILVDLVNSSNQSF